jgi:hypothetical protein
MNFAQHLSPLCFAQKRLYPEIATLFLDNFLGNLTLSGYNSKLSNARFSDKQNLHENKKFLGYKINIGYKNGLSLNNLQFSVNGKDTSLAKIDKWTENSIAARNNVMVDVLLKIFAFNEEEIKTLEKEIYT